MQQNSFVFIDYYLILLIIYLLFALQNIYAYNGAFSNKHVKKCYIFNSYLNMLYHFLSFIINMEKR